MPAGQCPKADTRAADIHRERELARREAVCGCAALPEKAAQGKGEYYYVAQ